MVLCAIFSALAVVLALNRFINSPVCACDDVPVSIFCITDAPDCVLVNEKLTKPLVAVRESFAPLAAIATPALVPFEVESTEIPAPLVVDELQSAC